MQNTTEAQPETITETGNIEIFGAREHNLKNFDLVLPRNQLIVFTGVSGSGKSSLAFDTLYAEGQRRYMESFSAYARNFIGNLERPDVDKINGLSPVISIEQKTASRNPRSTVGTLTEIYDFLRLFYARAADAYSYVTGKKMVRQSEDQIIDGILERFANKKLIVLAPMVKGRKGHYRELFKDLRKKGYTTVRIDGELLEISPKMQTDRYKTHDIELVVDKIVPKPDDRTRLTSAVKTALKLGNGLIMVMEPDVEPAFFSENLMCPDSGIAYQEPAPNLFSFNSPYGYCSTCKGMGQINEVTKDLVIPDPNLSINSGGLAPLGTYRDVWIFKKLQAVLKARKVPLSTPIKDLPTNVLNEILYGPEQAVSVKTGNGNRTEDVEFEGVIPMLQRFYDEGQDAAAKWADEYVKTTTCPTCLGNRLKKEALHFKLDEKNISELAKMDFHQLQDWLQQLPQKLTYKQNQIGNDILKELHKRVGFLIEVGLTYLNLNRPLKTLSGGEAQRIRLATQIGSQLTNVLYILDEPSIGLHQRDNHRLIKSLKNLRDVGNTVLVVEHDKDIMLEADFLVDIGPGAGTHGGHIVEASEPKNFIKTNGITAQYLNGQTQIPNRMGQRRKGTGKHLILKGATGNNLQNVTLKMPLGKVVLITGVSGSGKSSLIHGTLYPLLMRQFYKSNRTPLPYQSIEGLEHLDKVIEVDQSPIGRTPRSNPATYTGVFGDIRSLFAQLPEAKIRGYKPGRFSFNVKGGRCEECGGGGKKIIEMDFLPDVHVPCEACKGKRYNRETLEVRFKGKSISDVLDLTVEQALAFFENQPKIKRKIQTLNEVGLSYITLGQHATTLSGGEAQRVKLASELSKRDTGKTMFILDEPTTGLHFQDIEHLLTIVNKLADRGNTVLLIEHNMDVIKTADHIIDLGPDGGNAGGHIIAEGTPEQIVDAGIGFTAKFLKPELHF